MKRVLAAWLLCFSIHAQTIPTTTVEGSVFVVMKSGANQKLALAPVYVMTADGFATIEMAVNTKLKKEAKRYAASYLKAEIENDTKERVRIYEDLKREEIESYFAMFPDSDVKSDADGKFTLKFEGSEPRVIATRAQRKLIDETERYYWAFKFQPEGRTQQLLFSNHNFVEDNNILKGGAALFEALDQLKKDIQKQLQESANAEADRRAKQAQKNSASSLKWNLSQAEKGDAYGQFRIGERFRDGDGVPKDEGKAREYFRKAGEQGHKDAKAALEKMKAE